MPASEGYWERFRQTHGIAAERSLEIDRLAELVWACEPAAPSAPMTDGSQTRFAPLDPRTEHTLTPTPASPQ